MVIFFKHRPGHVQIVDLQIVQIVNVQIVHCTVQCAIIKSVHCTTCLLCFKNYCLFSGQFHKQSKSTKHPKAEEFVKQFTNCKSRIFFQELFFGEVRPHTNVPCRSIDCLLFG